MVHARLDGFRRLLHEALGVQYRRDPVHDGAQERDLLRAVLALPFRPPQRLVGPRELARPLRRLGRLLLGVEQAPRPLLLARPQERLQPPRRQLRHGQGGLRPFAGAGGERGQAGAIEEGQALGPRLEALAGPGQARALSRLLVQDLLRRAPSQPLDEEVELARAGGPQVALGGQGRRAQPAQPCLQDGRALRLELPGGLLQGGPQRRHGRSPSYRVTMPPVRARARTATKPAASIEARNSAGVANRAIDAGR